MAGSDALKYTFIVFLAIFEVGSLVCGVSQSSNMLIVGRAVAGIGASGLMNGALTIIAACSPLEKRASTVPYVSYRKIANSVNLSESRNSDGM
jgi:MFS family permease